MKILSNQLVDLTAENLDYFLVAVVAFDNATYLDDIFFKPLNVINIQLAEAYISKEMTDLCECIPYPF